MEKVREIEGVAEQRAYCTLYIESGRVAPSDVELCSPHDHYESPRLRPGVAGYKGSFDFFFRLMRSKLLCGKNARALFWEREVLRPRLYYEASTTASRIRAFVGNSISTSMINCAFFYT